MTDYLEPQQGENEDALWEAVRLLNALLRNTGEEENGAEEETAALPRREESGEAARAEDTETADWAEAPESAALTEALETTVWGEAPETAALTETPETTVWGEVTETADRVETPEGATLTETLESAARKEGEEAERLLLPLLDEMEALDRALEGRELLERTRTPAAREDGPGAGMGRNAPWTGPEGYRRETGTRTELFRGVEETERFGPRGRADVWTDEALQAEQLDQVFRRDSRRYDGGFFLY